MLQSQWWVWLCTWLHHSQIHWMDESFGYAEIHHQNATGHWVSSASCCWCISREAVWDSGAMLWIRRLLHCHGPESDFPGVLCCPVSSVMCFMYRSGISNNLKDSSVQLTPIKAHLNGLRWRNIEGSFSLFYQCFLSCLSWRKWDMYPNICL